MFKETQNVVKTGQWLEDRRKGIGGSDIGAILGLHPKKTPLMVWEEKTGRRQDFVDNDLTRSGHRLEPVVADWFAEQTGMNLVNPGNQVSRHKVHEWCLGTPDRIADDMTDPFSLSVVEIKTTGQIIDPADMPQYWFTQLSWYAGIMRNNLSDSICSQNFIAWFERVTGHFDYVTADFDPKFFQFLLDKAGEFWTKYVQTDTPPPPANVHDVVRLYPKHMEGKVIEAAPDVERMISELRTLKDQQREMKKAVDEKEDTLKVLMKDFEAILVDGKPVITWRSSKETECFDEARFAVEMPNIYAQYVRMKPGSRRFLVK